MGEAGKTVSDRQILGKLAEIQREGRWECWEGVGETGQVLCRLNG